MPVKLLNLDDRTFADLVEEERLLIPRYVRPWTDHNFSDPGIMLIELFAWLTEALLYRINRVPDASRMRLLELLGASFQPAQPAILELRVTWEGDGRCELPRLSRIQVDRAAGKPIVFEILRDATFTPQYPERTLTARQTQRTASRVLGKTGDASKLQLFRLEDGFFVPPPVRRQRLPHVTVDGQPWVYRPHLRESMPTDTHFAYKPSLGSIVFGDGRTGAIPPANAPIVVTYQPNPDRPHLVTDDFTSRGRPWQVFRLSRLMELSEAARPGDLEPHLEVLDSEASAEGVPWEYVPSFLDMAPEALQYTIEPWHNAVRFGNDAYGKTLAAEKLIRIDYCQTLGADVTIPAMGNTFSFWVDSNAGKGSWQQVEQLRALRGWVLSPGRNPTTLDEARSAVFALLEPGWRAVTGEDFVSLTRKNQPSVARAVCLPDYNPEDTESARTRPGHVGIIAVPSPIGELTRDAVDLDRIEALAPDGSHLVASAIPDSQLVASAVGRAAWLWDVKSQRSLAMVADKQPARFVFSPTGRHLVAVPSQDAATLWDTRQGRQVASLEEPAPSNTQTVPRSLSRVVFDPNDEHIVTVAADGKAILWESTDGVLCRDLGAALLEVAPSFSLDGRLLATARPDQTVAVWFVPDDRPPVTVRLGGPASQVVFSPDGTRLAIATATATADARVRLGRVRPADGAVAEEMTLQLGQAAEELLFDPGGLYLATRSADGEAILWSARTGVRLAELSQPGAVDRLVFSADGNRLATAHRDQTVRCWSTRDGHEVVALPGTLPVEGMAFSPSGRRLTVVSTAAERTIQLTAWDLRGDRTRLVNSPPPVKSNSAIVHVSGQWLAYDDEHLVRLWDLEQCGDITAIAADFDDPGVPTAGWRLVTSEDPADVVPGNHQPTVRLARGPYLWILSALDSQATKAAVQVLDAEHLYQIDAMLAARRLVTSRHHVVGPVYTDVDITLTVAARSPAMSPVRVEKEIRHALARFFDSLHGGPDGTGWPLGRWVYESEVYEVVEGVEVVDHVKKLSLAPKSDEKSRDVKIPSRNLVAFDVHVAVE